MGIVVVFKPTTKLAYIFISTCEYLRMYESASTESPYKVPLTAFLVFGTQEVYLWNLTSS